MEPLRVAAYCRVSTKKETQLASLAHQIMSYTEQISDHPGWVFSGVFWDCGRSGLRKKGRNGLKHMLESAVEGKFDYIITKSAKRVSRNTVELLQIKKYLEESDIKTVTGKKVWSANVIQQMLKNEKYKGDMMLQKTFTEDYLNGIRKKNVGQRTRYYVKGSHLAIISPEIFDKVQEEMLNRARLLRTADGNQISSGNRFSSKYLLSNLLICGYCGGGFRRRTERGKIVWRCGTRMEKGKAECENSPTLNDQDVREMLGKVVCNGEYDENVVKDRVKRIDVYEKRLIICYAEKEGYQICEFE